MDDEEFDKLNEQLFFGASFDTIRHGKAKIGSSFFEWHLNTDNEHRKVLVTYKNGGTWNDNLYVDKVDEVLVKHLAGLAENKRYDVRREAPHTGASASSYGRNSEGERGRSAAEINEREAATAAVLDLFQDNRLIKLVVKNVQKFHVGDLNVTELLMLSVVSVSVKNTSGIQPKLSGESGMGKTHSTRTMLHLMPPQIYRAASFSSKALFYDKTLRPKMVIFSDDVNLAPEVEDTVRAAMTNWESPTEHKTLDSNRNSVTVSLPPRIAFWLTSVSNKSTLQLQNRQVEMNVDESPDQDKRVEEHQRTLAEAGLPDFYVDEDVELLRQAFLHLNQLDFSVRIPFIQNIKFTDVRNRRNFPIFLDFIKAYCIMNYRARETDKDGMLIATKEDFDNALELFKTVAVQQVTKLNDKERRIAEVIRDNSPCDIETVMDETHLSNSYVYELIHGDKKGSNRGLLEKIPSLKLHPRNEFNEEVGHRWGRNHYSLPADWSLVSDCESIVYWEDTDDDQLRSVSDSFGEEFRNGESGLKAPDSNLDDDIADIASDTSTNFGTSEKDATHIASPLSPAPQRSSEVGFLRMPSNPLAALEAEKDVQKDEDSVSLPLSEVKRSGSDADVIAEDRHNHSGLWTRTNSKQSSAKAVKYVKILLLRDIPEFVGSDGEGYELMSGSIASLPEGNAKVLVNRRLAIYVEGEI
ncbi:MAG: hypothetical protein ACXV3D_05550 [Halobacteriota archaeon]